MEILKLMKAFNVADILNMVLPEGVGEIISFLTFMGFWLILCLVCVVYALTKEITYTNSRGRITMEGLAVVIYPDGGSREIILPHKANSHTEKMEGGDRTWVITHEGWQTKSNGVRYTLLHPDIPHNVSINQLVKFYTGFEGNVTDEQGNIQKMELRTIIRSARQQDSDIKDLANAAIEDLVDPNKKIINAAIAISLILAVAIAGAVIFMFMPAPAQQIITQVAQNVTAATTTTLPTINTIK